MFKQIIDYLPYNKKLYFWLWQDYSKNQRLEAASSVMRKAIKYAPLDLDIRWQLSVTLLKQGHYTEALFHLEYMIANWPNAQKKTHQGWFAQIHAIIAKCHLFLGNFSNAEQYVSIAQNIAPWDLDACETIINLYQSTDRFDEIPLVLDQYIMAYPQVYSPYVWRARHIHYLSYDPASALEWYEKAISKATKEMLEYGEHSRSSVGLFWVLIMNYIDALVQCGKDDAAWQLIRSYKNNPEIEPIFFEQIVFEFYLYTKKYSASEQIALSLIKRDKNKPIYWELLARAQLKQNRLNEANESIERALFINSEYIMIHETRAEIQMAQFKWDAAIETYKILIAFSPLETDWLEKCGYCYRSSGELGKACELYERVTKLDPLDAIAWADLGEIYFQLGQNDQAFVACERSLSFNRLHHDKQEQIIKIQEKTKK